MVRTLFYIFACACVFLRFALVSRSSCCWFVPYEWSMIFTMKVHGTTLNINKLPMNTTPWTAHKINYHYINHNIILTFHSIFISPVVASDCLLYLRGLQEYNTFLSFEMGQILLGFLIIVHSNLGYWHARDALQAFMPTKNMPHS